MSTVSKLGASDTTVFWQQKQANHSYNLMDVFWQN